MARIEEAVTGQLERGDELLARVNRISEAIRASDRSSLTVHPGLLDEEIGEGLDQSLRLRRETVERVDEPLALISQAQRSGGTLLARLFDGHPQCHVHPDELHVGDTRPHVWPELDLDDEAEVWFSQLQETRLRSLFKKGRRAVPLKKQASKAGETFYPFLLPPAFQRRLFLDEVERRGPITSPREILDCYMTSLFNGWLDNQNLRGANKRWVVAFSPRRAWGERLKTLFELYPDGRLISILRDPLSWYTSAAGRSLDPDPDVLVELWKRSVAEMLEASRRHPERVSIVRFEALVLDTEATMRSLADFLGIDFDAQLAVPTFNRHPTGPNSSYEVKGTGLVTESLDRYKERLSKEQQEFVRRECDERYQEGLAFLSERDGERAPPGTRRGSGRRRLSTAGERRRRIESVGYDYGAAAKEPVLECNLCGSSEATEVARRDRYGFPAALRVCDRCGLGFLSPRLTPIEYGRFYEAVYRPLVSAYHGRTIDANTVQVEQRAYAAELVGFLRPLLDPVPRSLIDVGGSTGVVGGALGESFDAKVTVLDPAPSELAVAHASGMETIGGFLEEYAPGGRNWDLVLLCQTIDHLLDVSGALTAIAGMMAPDGRAFVDVLDVLLASRRSGSIEDAVKVDHPFYLTRETARAYFDKSGLRVEAERLSDDGHWGFLLSGALIREPDWPAMAAGRDRLLEQASRSRAAG